MLLQQMINGLALGAIYALLALGYSMIFGVLSFINFAHGGVAMVAAYVTCYFATSIGVPFVISVLLGVAAAAVLGVVIEIIGYRPIRHAQKLSSLIASLGFSFILATGVQIVWGTRSLPMPSAVNMKNYGIGSININTMQIFILVVTALVMAFLGILVNKTRIGTAMRAVSLDQKTSGLMGINVNMIISITFALGSAIGALSGILMASYYGSVYSTMGDLIGTKGFAAVVLGGAGSIPGAVIGGFLIGIIESLAGAILGSQAREISAFIVLVLVLLFKPSGLMGKDFTKA